MSVKLSRLSSVMIEGRKPANRADALKYIEHHQKYRVDASMGCFAINVKYWSYRFHSQLEREATHDLIRASEFWEHYIDWNTAHEFENKHNVGIIWAGRSAGWACLTDKPGRYAFAEPDDVEDSITFTQRHMAACKAMSDQVAHWRLEYINGMFSRQYQFVPTSVLQYILKYINELQAVNADGQLTVPTSKLEKLNYAPEPTDNNGAWEVFQTMKRRFAEIDKQYPIPQRSSPYDLWPTTKLLETSNVLWDFNKTVDALAEYVVQYALEERRNASEKAEV